MQGRARVQVILGTMTFGKAVEKAAAYEITTQFLSTKKYREIDTAFLYEEGKSEEIIGEYLQDNPSVGSSVYLATKVNPMPLSGHSLRPEDVRRQFNLSLQHLRRPSVDLLYLHAPDRNTPIKETLRTTQEFYDDGKFKELGLSNYSAKDVTEICQLCEDEGWVKPTVYQGMYNSITRSVEDLFPVLRAHGIRFYAYNPLAGGLLTGRYKDVAELDTLTDGRFIERQHYQTRFWKQSYFEAIREVEKGIQIVRAEQGRERSMVEVALKWLIYHSKLDGESGDGVIIGVSKPSHFDDNMRVWAEEGKEITLLEKGILDACDLAWEKAKPDCPSYYR